MTPPTEMPPERACGNCDLCCVVMEIEELQKPVAQRCPHQLKKGGCAIYGQHPPSCQVFTCMWQMGFFDRRHKPSKIGWFAFIPEGESNVIVQVDPARPDAWRAKASLEALTMLSGAFNVVIGLEGKPIAFVPKGGDTVITKKRRPEMFTDTAVLWK